MTVSSFAHIVNGYGTWADRQTQDHWDDRGLAASSGLEPITNGLGRSHDMTIVFREVIRFY